jgi:hypothetical protein
MADTENEGNKTGGTVSPNTALTSLRQAVKQVEHEDYLDGQAAISAAISELAEEHGITSNMPEQQNDTDAGTGVGASTTPKLSRPNRRASVNEDAKMLMEQMGIQIKPKPSDPIAIENDVQNLIQGMNSQPQAADPAVSPPTNNKSAKPPNARYLRIIEAKKKQEQRSQTQSSSHHHLRSSTELSDVSKTLIESENRRWCQEFSQSTFKSYNEEMLFRNMQKMLPKKGQGSSASKSRLTVSSQEINRQTIKQKQKEFHDTWSQLGRGRRGRGEEKYMRDDDQENCLFQPTTNETKKKSQSSKSSPGDDDDLPNQESNFANFIARQEANERARRQDNESTKGKEDYEKYALNKKYCPVCRGKQSYDEVKEKRKNCPNCHVAYRPKTCWGDIEEKFYDRQNKYHLKYQENEEKRNKESEEDISLVEIRKMNSKTGEIHQIKQKGIIRRDENGEIIKWTKTLEKEFFDRHEGFKENVQHKLLKVEKEMYGKNILPKDNDDDDDAEEEEEHYQEEQFASSNRSRAGRQYYHQPQRDIGSTWSSGVNKMNDSRSFSAGRLGLRREYSERGGGGGGLTHASTQRIVRDENEYLFRYRRK